MDWIKSKWRIFFSHFSSLNIFLFENLYLLLEFQVIVQLFKKRWPISAGSWFGALCTVCMIEWRASSLAARSFWDLLESLIFQSSSSQCASHQPAIPRPYQGGFIMMISLHFSSLLVMRNESSFGEKEGEWSTGGLFLHLFLLLHVIVGDGFAGWGMWALFLKPNLLNPKILCCSSHQTVVNYRGAVSVSIIQTQKMEENARMY